MGTKERKEREREARKGEILEAAKTVFFEKGFQATKMDQIAEAAELSKGALYLYFPSKEELYVSLLVEGLDILISKFEEAVTGVQGWENKIRGIGLSYYEYYLNYKNYFVILFFLQHGDIAANVTDELYQRCTEKGLSCLNFIAQALKEGMDEGEIEPQDPMEISVILWGALNGIFLLYEEDEHKKFIPTELDKMFQTSMWLILEGLKRRA